MVDVSIIIVNYNTADWLKDCIDSILRQIGVSVEVIVVDNASTDHSVKVIKQAGSVIKTILNPKNIGFARANNQAFKLSTGQYIFLLNPDAHFQTPQDLENLIYFARQHPQFGLVGAHMLNPDGSTEAKPKFYYPDEKYIGAPYRHLPGKIAWLLGACMLIPRSVYEKVNGFDERFFLYGEDIDLCLRIRKKGYEIGYDEAVSIIHAGNASERQTDRYEKSLKKQKALQLFYEKHYQPAQTRLLMRRGLKRAKWRMWYYSLWRFSQKAKMKYHHYRAIYDNSKQFL